MQRVGERPIYSASDLNDFLECRHLSELQRHAALDGARPPQRDAAAKLLARKGDEHERRYLERLKARGARVLEMPASLDVRTLDGLIDCDRQTRGAMETGADYIYQPTFFDGTFLGRADFLRRVDRPCADLAWSYEAVDAKLARATKTYFLVQLCSYSEQIARLQGGTFPERIHVALGSGEERTFHTRDFAAYYRRLRDSFLACIETESAYPYECAHCSICSWSQQCERQRRADDHLSLVAWMRRDQIAKLEDGGVATLAALAAASDDTRPLGMASKTFADLRLQAQLQLAQRDAIAAGAGGKDRYHFRILPYDDKGGFSLLPTPDEGDVYFDIEGDPFYAAEGGLEYLFGIYLPREDRHRSFWARSAAHERRAVTELIDFLLERRSLFPNMHVYHYANYEKAALGRLCTRYATRRDELDDLLRSQTFVDLFSVVRQGLRISQESYSIKKLEPFYEFERKAELRRGDDSILLFEEWLDTGDETLLQNIEHYNDEDCRSTYHLHRWLLERRAELHAAGTAIEWKSAAESKEMAPEERRRHAEMSELRAAILGELAEPADEASLAGYSDEHRVRWYLANLVDYHWNESKPQWWRFHYRCQNVDELVEFDHEAIGGLHWLSEVGPYTRPGERNAIYTYSFPEQQHRLGSDPPVDPDTGAGAGEVIEIDDAHRILKIKRSAKVDHAALRALVPARPRDASLLQQALMEIGRAYAGGSLERSHPAILDLVLAAPPRLRDRARGAAIQPEVVDGESLARCIDALDSSYLMVQGPPGSGKSTLGGEAIARLLAEGRRIGILTRSHKAAHNLLQAVERAATRLGITFTGAHKGDGDDAFSSELEVPLVVSEGKAEAALDPRYRLVSGTPWVFARSDAVDAFDVLVIDEAGQLALADAIACARAGRSVVLLGDPLQLGQISQGSHPPGIGRSILEHLLGDRATIPPERGIFLPHSWRMHPAICSFISSAVYDGRLQAADGNDRNAVASPGLHGSGLRWLAVEHRDNRRESSEEADAIVSEIRALLAGTCTLRGEPERQLTPNDVLVVSPYNAQRTVISQRLAAAGLEEIRVGTVDKFQGQQAPVVFYSMATSSGDDLPRDMAFLFERNRLNVAISRAQCLSVLACSPRLLEVRCTTPEQMALANLLCAFCEPAAIP